MQEEKIARICREQEFYTKCGELLHIEHEYHIPYARKTRWNARILGNGRYPSFGVIRYLNDDHIMVMSRKGTRLFETVEEVYNFIKDIGVSNGKKIEELYQLLVNEREKRMIDADNANPDVGMGPFPGYFRDIAIRTLQEENIIPLDYKE